MGSIFPARARWLLNLRRKWSRMPLRRQLWHRRLSALRGHRLDCELEKQWARSEV